MAATPLSILMSMMKNKEYQNKVSDSKNKEKIELTLVYVSLRFYS
jgi:hypothetical protein